METAAGNSTHAYRYGGVVAGYVPSYAYEGQQDSGAYCPDAGRFMNVALDCDIPLHHPLR